jgi:hypothetical protein
MNRRAHLLAALPFLMLTCAIQAAEPGKEIDLLANWPGSGETQWQTFIDPAEGEAASPWSTEKDVLRCKGTPQGYIYTTGDFTNFVLKLQWRWPQRPGRGGILVRITGEHRIWPKSLEAQLNVGDAGDFWGLAGYQLDGPAERKKVLELPNLGRLINLRRTMPVERKAGEWNDYEIRAEGDTVVLSVNGQEVNRATGCEVVAGKICLTAEGDEIEFRNVRLTPLDN